MLLPFTLVTSIALAQEVPLQDQLLVAPSAPLEDGPAAIYLNPSALAYDTDPRWGAFFRTAFTDNQPYRLTFTGGRGIFGAGFRSWWSSDAPGADFGLDFAMGIPLPMRLSVGFATHWMILTEAKNYVSFDLSASWRPIPWFGLTALTRNLGSSGNGRSPAQSGGGVALRPLGDSWTVGVEYLYTAGTGPYPTNLVNFSTRVRPTPGLFFRASIDTSLRVDAAVEMYFGGPGAGVGTSLTDLGDGPLTPELAVWVSSSKRVENIAPKHHRIVRIDLMNSPPDSPRGSFFGPSSPTWTMILGKLSKAAEDPFVDGVILSIGSASQSWARWQELHDGVDRLQRLGKKVFVYLTESPGDGGMLVASAADQVWAHPAATLDLVGPSAELVYMGGLLDAAGVTIDVARRSSFKSAAESLSEVSPSPQELEQRRRLVDVYYASLQTALASRATSQTRPETGDEAPPNSAAMDIAAQWIAGGPWSPEEAARVGLIDGIVWPDQLPSQLDNYFGRRENIVEPSDKPPPQRPWQTPTEIAVVHLEGTLVTGESTGGTPLSGPTTGSTTFARLMKSLAKDVKTRALVLRVNSPGGSLFASEEMARALEGFKQTGKPVVASYGGVAASGGYFVGVGADVIYAEPTTVTGSIGVISFKPSFGRLSERLGLTVTPIRPSASGGYNSLFQAWTPTQRARMESLVNTGYKRFKQRIVAARGLPADQVEAAAQGRVWAGQDALELGLIDSTGGLQTAIEEAITLAKLSESNKNAISVIDYNGRRPSFLDIATPLLPFAITPQAKPVALELKGELWTSWLPTLLNTDEQLWMLTPWWLDGETR